MNIPNCFYTSAKIQNERDGVQVEHKKRLAQIIEAKPGPGASDEESQAHHKNVEDELRRALFEYFKLPEAKPREVS